MFAVLANVLFCVVPFIFCTLYTPVGSATQVEGGIHRKCILGKTCEFWEQSAIPSFCDMPMLFRLIFKPSPLPGSSFFISLHFLPRGSASWWFQLGGAPGSCNSLQCYPQGFLTPHLGVRKNTCVERIHGNTKGIHENTWEYMENTLEGIRGNTWVRNPWYFPLLVLTNFNVFESCLWSPKASFPH
jgi:hypothetical protein